MMVNGTNSVARIVYGCRGHCIIWELLINSSLHNGIKWRDECQANLCAAFSSGAVALIQLSLLAEHMSAFCQMGSGADRNHTP
ncbi:hypothetical protein CPB83DRAFT_264925 [Crepidotus variabilis]|uniref:Uncharacterized protein n=1 Tax=Crepidotus variabilis TaxID=179855 RepID=A0A9P6EHZ8_9AGAR|nr:hypothetical protein CPB83DRAFT_264925 [Crepidotus variabilis]